ncbi:UDP-glucosyltransferase 2-like [Leguminivora glycinivorella]|uniref:UDP-glucosyltransferase 2-like n=1 Tax=Leguminivora glycinivorella TaxID=1035111 RepID=UPI00200EFF8F|nr:UDP-glucosyltransferase 2-like [Leguminivora glycinivorella]
MSKFITLALMFCVVNTIHCARILCVFPAPSLSHAAVFRILTEELANRGHELVVITPDPAYKGKKSPANFTEIDVHDVSYKVWNNMVESANGASLYKQLTATMQVLADLVKVQQETPQVKEFMAKNQKFDLVLTEASIVAALGYAHKFKAPVIQVSSFYGITSNFEGIGAPTHLFLYPAAFRKKLMNLTMKDKIKDVLITLVLNVAYIGYEREVNGILKTYFGEDTPDLRELESNVDMLFVNTNPVWEGNRPVPSSVVYLGQFHIPPVKDLPQDLKSYLDSSSGVIYVSYGSNFSPSSLSEDKISLLLTVFSKLPYDVLCKWDTEDLPALPSNVKVRKWLPQNDLLRHPKIKLFITQGGMQSTDEAIVAGVPLIGMPLRADQFFNAEKYVQHKIGEKLDWNTLTEDELYNTILKVAGDESYRQNVLKLQTLMADQPMSALERAVWWTEHVLRHGGARHLRAPAAGVGWADYYELKLVAVLLSMSLVTVMLLIGFIYVLGKFVSKIKKVFVRKIKNE